MNRAEVQTLQAPALYHLGTDPLRLITHLQDAMGLITFLIKELAHRQPRKSVTCSKTEISIPCVNTMYLSNGVHKNAGKCKLSSWSRLGTSMQRVYTRWSLSWEVIYANPLPLGLLLFS